MDLQPGRSPDRSQSPVFRAISFALVGFAALSIGGLLYLVLYSPVDQKSLALEIGKSLLQVLVVGVAGGLITLLTTQWQRGEDRLQHERDAERARLERERDAARVRLENRTALQREFIRRLHHAYTTVKRTKRMLRATAFVPAYYGTGNEEALVLMDPYDSLLQELNATQLELEVIAKELRQAIGVFAQRHEIAASVSHMEDTIKDVITEYERERGNFLLPENSRGRTVKQLPELRKFVDSSRETDVTRRYTVQYSNAVELMHRELNMPWGAELKQVGAPDIHDPSPALIPGAAPAAKSGKS